MGSKLSHNTGGSNMKFRKISVRLLACLLPVILIAMVILTAASVMNSKQVIDTMTADNMTANLDKSVAEVLNQLDSIKTTAKVLAEAVASDYHDATLPSYEKMLQTIVAGNDIALGSGIWFEPYVYDKNEKYVGPYVYKAGASLITTYEYSNADYDYHARPYYTVSQGLDYPVITDPYYDAPSGNTLSTCSVAIYDDGTYIGCASVGISLETIVQIVNDIKVGQNGTGLLLTSSGTYLAGVDQEKIASESSILDETNSSLVAAGNTILNSETGITTYTGDQGLMQVYYTTLPQTNWKLAIQIPVSELSSSVNRLMTLLIVICVVAVAVSTLFILFIVNNIAGNIKNVQRFATSLAEGDFTVDPLRVKSADELGTMSTALNEMFLGNKQVIQTIAEHATEINASSKKLREASGTLHQQFEDIHSYMSNVNEAMLSTSAATEEVNASTEEVLSNVNLLTGETGASADMAREIKGRAAQISEECRTSSESANKLSEQFEKNLEISIRDAAVVSNISEMADVISNIAEQINLLSLNASIEAARAGEAGRGFAVVASEIGNLAGSTTEAIGKIQETIEQVQKAFSSLTKDAQEMLNFVQDTVTPDYNKFVDVANQYGDDANSFEESSEKLSEMSSNIRKIMTEVSDAIQNITEATQDTTQTSQNILEAIDRVGGQVQEVDTMSENQDTIAADLDQVVGKFKLS